MKILNYLFFVFFLLNFNVSLAEGCFDGDAIIFPPSMITTYPTSCLSYTTRNIVESKRKSLMVEAAPLAIHYLLNGEDLNSPALDYAMNLLARENPKVSREDLALRIIEEANAE